METARLVVWRLLYFCLAWGCQAGGGDVLVWCEQVAEQRIPACSGNQRQCSEMHHCVSEDQQPSEWVSPVAMAKTLANESSIPKLSWEQLVSNYFSGWPEITTSSGNYLYSSVGTEGWPHRPTEETSFTCPWEQGGCLVYLYSIPQIDPVTHRALSWMMPILLMGAL